MVSKRRDGIVSQEEQQTRLKASVRSIRSKDKIERKNRKKREEKKKGRDKIMKRVDKRKGREEMRLHKTDLRDNIKKTRRDNTKKDQKKVLKK